MEPKIQPNFAELLQKAVTEPGLIQKAYSAFYGYSLGNQMLALIQCMERDIEPGPIATYKVWTSKNRQVKRGSKAIMLCMPVTRKRRAQEPAEGEEPAEPGVYKTFIYKNNWFVLSQTEGEPYESPHSDTWNADLALPALDITEEPFHHLDGNCQGYARLRTIAVSPLAGMPEKTRFHEIAHVLLGHTTEHEHADNERTPRTIREVEAESVAMLCLESLGLPGSEFCRGYIQGWNVTGEPIPEKSAQKIFKIANQILKAGMPPVVSEVAE